MASREIEKIGKLIADLFKDREIVPGRVVLYGSYAKERPAAHSDMDVIIVSESFRGKDIFKRVALARGIHRELVRKFRKPFDIMYYSDREWDEGSSLLVREAKQTGKVIFTAA